MPTIDVAMTWLR